MCKLELKVRIYSFNSCEGGFLYLPLCRSWWSETVFIIPLCIRGSCWIGAVIEYFMSTLICLHSQIANTRISHPAKLAQPAREAEVLSLRVSWSCWYCKALTITFTAFRGTDTKIIQDLTCVSHSMSSRVLFICVLVCRHPGDIDAEPFRFAYLVIYDLPGCGFYQFDTRVVRKRLNQWRQKDSQS